MHLCANHTEAEIWPGLRPRAVPGDVVGGRGRQQGSKKTGGKQQEAQSNEIERIRAEKLR